MAKVIVEVDTDKPEIMLKIDGESIDGATYVCFSKYYNDDKEIPYISIDIPKRMDNGLTTMMRYYSSSSQIDDNIITRDNKTLKGFTGIVKLSSEFAKLLS